MYDWRKVNQDKKRKADGGGNTKTSPKKKSRKAKFEKAVAAAVEKRVAAKVKIEEPDENPESEMEAYLSSLIKKLVPSAKVNSSSTAATAIAPTRDVETAGKDSVLKSILKRVKG